MSRRHQSEVPRMEDDRFYIIFVDDVNKHAQETYEWHAP